MDKHPPYLREALDACHSCALCGRDYGKPDRPPAWRKPIQKVHAEGSFPAQVVLIGEAPGEQEDLEGRPFVGKSGEFLRELLAVSGLDQACLLITNTVRCRPPGNRKPTPEEKHSCWTWLDIDLTAADPDYIICLGDSAMSTFFPGGKVKGKVADWFGKTLPLDSRAIGCYHPAARSASQRGMILPLFKDITRRLGYDVPPQEEVNYEIREV